MLEYFSRILEKHYLKISILILIIIFVLSLTPLPQLPKFPGSDKTHHFIAYSILAFPVSFIRPKYWTFFVLFYLLCSGLIELIQPFVNRYGEWLDMLANSLGLCMGVAFGLIINFIVTKYTKNS